MNELTPPQLYKMGIIYDALAKLVPVEGRDFNITVDFNDNNQTIQIVGKTDIGRAFAAHCTANMQQAINEVINDRTSTN